jgi:hypothetical protein
MIPFMRRPPLLHLNAGHAWRFHDEGISMTAQIGGTFGGHAGPQKKGRAGGKGKRRGPKRRRSADLLHAFGAALVGAGPEPPRPDASGFIIPPLAMPGLCMLSD